MKFQTFKRLFIAANPGGTAWLDEQRRVNVAFQEHGRVYTYRRSIYEVAERLGLIPAADYDADAMRIVTALESGAQSVRGLQHTRNTVRALWRQRHNTQHVVDGYGEIVAYDDVDRPLVDYALADTDPY